MFIPNYLPNVIHNQNQPAAYFKEWAQNKQWKALCAPGKTIIVHVGEQAHGFLMYCKTA